MFEKLSVRDSHNYSDARCTHRTLNPQTLHPALTRRWDRYVLRPAPTHYITVSYEGLYSPYRLENYVMSGGSIQGMFVQEFGFAAAGSIQKGAGFTAPAATSDRFRV